MAFARRGPGPHWSSGSEARPAVGRGNPAACRPCARVRGRRRGAQRADGARRAAVKLGPAGALAEWGLAAEAQVLKRPSSPARRPRRARLVRSTSCGALVGRRGRQRAPACDGGWGVAICGWRRVGQRCVCRVTWLETGKHHRQSFPGKTLRGGMGPSANASLVLFRFLGKLLPGPDAPSAEAR